MLPLEIITSVSVSLLFFWDVMVYHEVSSSGHLRRVCHLFVLCITFFNLSLSAILHFEPTGFHAGHQSVIICLPHIQLWPFSVLHF